MSLNIFIIRIIFLVYIASLCFGTSNFYVQVLTPRKGLSHPQKICFLLLFFLTAGTVFVFFNSTVISSIWFLTSLALPAFVLFQNKVLTKIFMCFLALLSCSFAEMTAFALLLAINLFFPEKDLIPAHIFLSGDVFLSFITFAIISFAYTLLLFVISKALKSLLAYLRPRTGILLAFPFFIAIINVGALTNIENHKDLFIYTPALIISLAFALVILAKGLRELQKQELLALQTKKQKKKAEYQLLYYQKMGEEFISLRKWKHDMSNHIVAITFLLENENYGDAKKYLEELL